MYIKDLVGFQILDSRGNPTIAVKITLSDNRSVLAKVPSGASTGSKEALELRDNDLNHYDGKSVYKAISNINEIIRPCFLNSQLSNFYDLDQKLKELDSTLNKEKLGANTLLGVSIALTKAVALASSKPLYQFIKENLMNNYESTYYAPVPLINLINGGAHSNNLLDFQEFMIVPTQANSFSEAIEISAKVFYSLEKIIKEKMLSTNKGDEGGFSPELNSNHQALDLLVEAINRSGYKPSKINGVAIALDVAASELFTNNKYIFKKQNPTIEFDKDQWKQYLKSLIDQYPIISIEDGFDEEDWDGFVKFNQETKIQTVGDDLYCTNPKYLRKGIEILATNAILIKPNQIGTVSETIETIKLAYANNFKTIISHRSGDTEDDFIADLAIGTSSKQIKTGSLSRSERVAKYNRILEIEQELEGKLIYEFEK